MAHEPQEATRVQALLAKTKKEYTLEDWLERVAATADERTKRAHALAVDLMTQLLDPEWPWDEGAYSHWSKRVRSLIVSAPVNRFLPLKPKINLGRVSTSPRRQRDTSPRVDRNTQCG